MLVNRIGKLSADVSQSVLTGLVLAEVIHAVHEASGAIRLVLSRSIDPLTGVVPGSVVSPCRGAVNNFFVWLKNVEEGQLNTSAGDVVQASIGCQNTRLDEQTTFVNGLVQITSKGALVAGLVGEAMPAGCAEPNTDASGLVPRL